MPLGDSITAGYCENRFGGYRYYLFNLLYTNGYEENFDFVGKYNDGLEFDCDHNGTDGAFIAAYRDNATSTMEDVVSNRIIEVYQPDIILLEIGSNDISHMNESEALRWDTINDRFELLVDEILERIGKNKKLFVATLPYMQKDHSHCNQYIDEFNAFIKLVVDRKQDIGYDVSLVDINRIIGPDDLEDFVHPNIKGYEKMAAIWYEKIINYISKLNIPD